MTVTLLPGATVDALTVSVGGFTIVNVSAPDVPPPGDGEDTVICAVPGEVMSAAVIDAVSATTVAPGGSITATLTGGAGGSTDWLALASTSSPDTSYIRYVFVGGGVTTRTWTVDMNRKCRRSSRRTR